MRLNDDLIESDIAAYLEKHEHKSLLRFITCGSVDDGKSTLIGRLLYDAKMIFEDQLASLESDSKKVGTQGENIDFALLVDGLTAEREQGITIDVAYRFFATDKRKFIVADTPGHEQYTRNMATGASTADVAILMVDARKGILTQTRRHSFITSLLGIRKVVLAINKMDLINYSQQAYDDIVDDFYAFADELATDLEIQPIPMSALEGVNITSKSNETDWYDGPSLMDYLETVPVGDRRLNTPFRMPSNGSIDPTSTSGVSPDRLLRARSNLVTASNPCRPGSSPPSRELSRRRVTLSRQSPDNPLQSRWTMKSTVRAATFSFQPKTLPKCLTNFRLACFG